MAEIFWCCVSEQEKAQRTKSRHIDKILAKEKIHYKRRVKLLLLGAGESGKSTFMKQMKIIHGQDFDDEQMREYKLTVFSNIVKGCRVLIDARDKLKIPWGSEEAAKQSQTVFNSDQTTRIDEINFLRFVESLKTLWSDSGIQTAFDRRREFQLGDNLKYFLDNLDRVGQKGYTPTKQDVLHARKPTKGILQHEISIKGHPFLFVDVGGQRSQRQKWFQCFEDITSILFLASSSEFDQVLMEDRKTNRLIESCNIFETIINNKSFCNVSIILFLNKTDLLKEKVRQNDISKFFPNFEGDPHNIDTVQTFLLNMFDERRRERSRPLFHHFTTAVDTENIRFVFQAVKDTILQDNLKSLMLQ